MYIDIGISMCTFVYNGVCDRYICYVYMYYIQIYTFNIIINKPGKNEFF